MYLKFSISNDLINIYLKFDHHLSVITINCADGFAILFQ